MKFLNVVQKIGLHVFYLVVIAFLCAGLVIAMSNRGSASTAEPTDLGEKIAYKLDKVANAVATAPNDLTSSVISALYHWQGLIGALFAVIVGVLTIVFTATAIQAQIDSDNRRYAHDLRLKTRAYRLSLRPLAKNVLGSATHNLQMLNSSIQNARERRASHPYHDMRETARNAAMPVSDKINERWEQIVVAGGRTLEHFLSISDALENYERAKQRIAADVEREDWGNTDQPENYTNYLADMTTPLTEIRMLAEQVWNTRD